MQFADWSDWNSKNIELSNNVLYNNFIFLEYEQSGIYSTKYSNLEINNTIQGLITYQYFQKQYKNYCDISYKSSPKKKGYKDKLKGHFKRLISPFYNIKSWISEVFSVLYYTFIVLFTGWRDND